MAYRQTCHPMLSLRAVFVLSFIVGVLNIPTSDASSKKGLCIGLKTFLCKDFDVFTNFNWWYDWTKDYTALLHHTNCTVKDFSPHFVPMIHGWNNNPHHLEVLSGAQHVLVYNEPDMHSGANLSAVQAANHWHAIQNKFHGTPLVGPATAFCHNPHNCRGNSTQWLDQFFQHCNGSCHMDYLGAHVYNCDADQSMDYLNMLYTRYGKKIWLTEFACPHTHSVNVQLHYMHQMLPRLEAADYIVKYSWFNSRVPGDGFVTSSASLLELNESKLTPLGRYYIHFRGSSGPAIVG